LYEDSYNVWVAFAVVEGAFYYEIGEMKGTATFGDIVICPPETVFKRVIMTPLTFYYFEFSWSDGTKSIEPEAKTGLSIPSGKISLLDTARLAQNYNAMRKWKDWPLSTNSSLYNHYLRDLWLMYCEEQSEGSGADFVNNEDPLMQEAHSLIHQKAFSTLNLKQIASLLGITPVQLTKKFTSAYGVTPQRYLTSLRLNKAKMLLLESKMTVEQISECCGYLNGFYLNRIFAKYEHMTPSQYRKTHRV
jgi:AraC-like DNA-binding protein